MSQPQDINTFLKEQLTNTLNFLSQSQTIGNTHFLYSVTVINDVAQSINQALQILSTPPEKPKESVKEKKNT